MSPIDLRSDTVTKPTPAMRRAMAEAEVGDDVLDGDPTTRRLEQRIASLLGTEDALFFPSGTQANQTGVALCTTPGTELILEANAHLVHYELAGVAALSGVQIRPVATPDGLLTADLVRAALRPVSPHVPRISAVAVENTHNAAGGKVMPPAVSADIVTAARTAGLSVHLDGARLWNAATALDARRWELPGKKFQVSIARDGDPSKGAARVFRACGPSNPRPTSLPSGLSAQPPDSHGSGRGLEDPSRRHRRGRGRSNAAHAMCHASRHRADRSQPMAPQSTGRLRALEPLGWAE